MMFPTCIKLFHLTRVYVCMYVLYICIYNIASSNVLSIEDNNAESYSNKSNKPNNTSISNWKKVNFRHNRKEQERKKNRSSQLLWVILCSKIFMDASYLILIKKLFSG